MNIRHSKAHELLAIAAGKAAGLDAPTSERVARSKPARAERDRLWGEYEKRLRDFQGETLEGIQAWLESQGAAVSLSSVNRDRAVYKQQAERLALSVKRTQEVLAAVDGMAEGDLLKASRKLIGQIVMEYFLGLEAEALGDATTAQTIRLMEAVGTLSKSRAETEVLEERLVDLRAETLKAVGAVANKGRVKPATREAIYKAIDEALKGA